MAYFLALFVMLVCDMGTLCGRDFGTVGTTFPIQEQNLLEYLRERLLCANKEELGRFYQEQAKRVQEPKMLNLSEAQSNRVFFYDPTITVWDDVKDHEGNVIVKRGEKYNPLDHSTLSNELLFFDATKTTHIEWAQAHSGMWILVKGKPIQLEEEEGVPVYFDQFGYLTKKFGIQAVPARVSQQGKLLRIEEIAMEAI